MTSQTQISLDQIKEIMPKFNSRLRRKYTSSRDFFNSINGKINVTNLKINKKMSKVENNHSLLVCSTDNKQHKSTADARESCYVARLTDGPLLLAALRPHGSPTSRVHPCMQHPTPQPSALVMEIPEDRHRPY